MPDLTMESAAPRISSSLTLQANLFQVFQPMGGVRARLAEGLESWAEASTAVNAMAIKMGVVIFMAVGLRIFIRGWSGWKVGCSAGVPHGCRGTLWQNAGATKTCYSAMPWTICGHLGGMPTSVARTRLLVVSFVTCSNSKMMPRHTSRIVVNTVL